MSEPIFKPHLITVSFQTSTLDEETGERFIDTHDPIVEGARSPAEYKVKRDFIKAALEAAKLSVVTAMEDLASSALAEGKDPDDINWLEVEKLLNPSKEKK